jgi:GNAT superfamily N-acetyltransferase
VRLVRIAGFDENPCCGTHVANTAEAAPILLGRAERVRGALRVELRAGDRSLAEVRRQRGILEGLCRASGAGPLELAGWAAATLADVKELRRELTAARETLAGFEARDLAAGAAPCGPVRVVARVLEDRAGAALRDLARELSRGPGLIAILGAMDDGRPGLVVARADGVPIDARQVLAAAAAVLGARGGGRPELAQAGGGDPARLKDAVERAAAECDRLLAAGAQGEGRSGIAVRPARTAIEDARVICRFIRELAAYEREPEAAEATPEGLLCDLEARPRPFECLLAEQGGEPAGFALYFFNYSTWKGRPGLYVEDLYVPPPFRGRGIGRALFAELGRIARARGCGRMEWSVLDWNTPAIRFYEGLGAGGMHGWTVYRLSGEALAALAQGGSR